MSLHVPSIHHTQVGFEPIHDGALSLPDILLYACFTCNAVYEICTFASPILSRLELPTRRCVHNHARCVQASTICIILGFTTIVGCAAWLLFRLKLAVSLDFDAHKEVPEISTPISEHCFFHRLLLGSR